jgi:LDH2 family malate/lactate/ureidoglycolate dehydrogenase
MRSVTVSLSKLKSYCDDILIKVGIPEQEAEIITDSLLEANLGGVDTHGVLRLSTYA